MRAVIRYVVGDLRRSQRWVPPVFVNVAVLAVMYLNNPGPLLPAFAASAALLCATAVWLTVAVMNSEDQTQRTITVTACGSYLRLVIARALLCLIGVVLLSVLSVGWALYAAHEPPAALLTLLGVGTHLTCGCFGIGVGLLCSKPLVSPLGVTLLLGGIIVLIALVAPWTTPVNPVLRMVTTGRVGTSLAEHVAAALAVAVVLLVLAVGAAARLGRQPMTTAVPSE